MKVLLKNCKDFREKILILLWRQWTAIGVAGQTKSNAMAVIDPEALLLCSLSLCRYDSRLYDEVMDWLMVNGEFINVQRLSTMQVKYNFSTGPQLSAAAEYLSLNSEYRLKWHRISKEYRNTELEPLFYTIQGKPLPVGKDQDKIFLSKGLNRNRLKTRNYSSSFPVDSIPAMILQLRALIGVSARCEMFAVLSGGAEVHPAEAARLTGYNRKTVQNSLREMSRSGFIMCREGEREKNYRLQQHSLKGLMPSEARWTFWPPLYKALEILWFSFENEIEDPLILSAQLRRFAQESQKYFEESKTGILLSDPARTPGAEYISVFLKDILRIPEECGNIL